MNPFATIALIAALIFPTAFSAAQDDSEDKAQAKPSEDIVNKTLEAIRNGRIEDALKLSEGTTNERLGELRASIFQQRGEKRFIEGNIKESIEDFDAVIELRPDRDPYHWQRGIAYYYADRFQEGKEQFERHQTVNSQDVENAVWHFLCAVRAPGGSVESARSNLISITGDTRVPMKEVHDLFAGKGSEESVISAAKNEGNPQKSPQARNAMMYAHLYLGIYHEALGDTAKMKEHIKHAASTYRMEHYMGKVAQVHAKLRQIQL